jgi:hypothetical protein
MTHLLTEAEVRREPTQHGVLPCLPGGEVEELLSCELLAIPAAFPVLWIRIRVRIRIHRIHMFLGLPDPDPSISKQN